MRTILLLCSWDVSWTRFKLLSKSHVVTISFMEVLSGQNGFLYVTLKNTFSAGAYNAFVYMVGSIVILSIIDGGIAITANWHLQHFSSCRNLYRIERKYIHVTLITIPEIILFREHVCSNIVEHDLANWFNVLYFALFL